MRLDPDGAQLFPSAFTPAGVDALATLLSSRPIDGPGWRLGPSFELARAIDPAVGIAEAILGPGARAVRATPFDKAARRNWSVGWHQDRTIAVRARIDTPGFTGWTVKAGIAHVVPPFEFLARMLTLRIHVDPAGPDNAPLLIVPASHDLGRIAEPDIPTVAARLGQAECPADSGDIWVYATPILHASARAVRPSRRRVLQLLFSVDELPNGLSWLGV